MKLFCFPRQRPRIQRTVEWYPVKHSARESASLLRAESPAPLLSPVVKAACMQSSRRTMRIQSVLPGVVYNTGHSYQPSPSVVLPPGKHSVGNQSHQQPRTTEKTNVTVLNQPKMQRKKSLPLQRERERKSGKEWAKPESSGALPKPLEACDRS